jgi:hypothetical protein
MSVEKLREAIRKDGKLVDELLTHTEEVLKRFNITGPEYNSWMQAAKTGKLKDRINTLFIIRR